jgi:predicted ATPase
VQELAGGKGGLVFIQGEGGTGKSRLLSEVLKLAARRKVPSFTGRGLPYRSHRPLAPFHQIATQALGIPVGASPQELRERLERLRHLGLAEVDREILRGFFAVDFGKRFRGSADAVFRAAGHFVEALGAQQPVIIVLEDVHLLQPLERALAAHIIQSVRAGPVLFLCSSREPAPEDFGAPDLEINLGTLATEEQARLLQALLGVREVDSALLELVAAAAEGNPFYAEAVVSTLEQDGRLLLGDGRASLDAQDEELHLPPDLGALIAGRIDALSPISKAGLQVAATIGVHFSPELFARAGGVEDPEALLADLESRGLIIRGNADEEMRFVSPFVWEVAHHAIPEARREEVHRQVADALLELHAGALEPHRRAIGRHAAAGGQPLIGARHALRAGLRLWGQQLVDEAISCWEEGLGWAGRAMAMGQPIGLCDEVEAWLRLRIGQGHAHMGRYKKARLHLEVGLDLFQESGDVEGEACALLAIGKTEADQGHAALAIIQLEAAEECAQRGVSPPLDGWRQTVAVEALDERGMLLQQLGRADEATACFQLALELAGSDERLGAAALLGLASRQRRDAELESSQALLEEAMDKAERVDDPILLARIVNTLGTVHYHAGKFDDAIAAFRRSLVSRERIGHRPGMVVNLHNIGDAHLRQGRFDQAWTALSRSQEMAVEIGWEKGEMMNAGFLAFLEGLRAIDTGRAEEAEGCLGAIDRAAAKAAELGDLEMQVTTCWLKGRLLAGLGRVEEAKVVLDAALKEAKEIGDDVLAQEVGRDRAAME